MKKAVAFACALGLVFLLMTATVLAGSAVLYEPTSGLVLYEQDAYTPRPMASTTKLMTALLAAECGDWDRTVQVTAEMVAVEGTSLGLRAGDTLTLKDAVCGMLLASGNDAAGAVALTLAPSFQDFSNRMNQKAAELGMSQSRFVTPSGLDAEGHAASAYDMALLGAAVLREPILSKMCAQKQATITVSGRSVTVTNHNRLLSLYPDAVGLKTGFTKKAGRCLVSAARRDGVTLVAVTLNEGDDWNRHAALFEQGFSMVRAVELPKLSLPLLSVTGGTDASVTLYSASPEPLILPAAQKAETSVVLELPPFVFAPVAAGDTVGEAVYLLNGEELFRAPVFAANGVEARPVADRKTRFLKMLSLLWADLLNTT